MDIKIFPHLFQAFLSLSLPHHLFLAQFIHYKPTPLDKEEDEVNFNFVKPEKNLIFLKNGKNNKISRMVQGSLEKYLDLK